MTASVSTISRSGSRKGYGKGRRKKVPSWGTLGAPNPTCGLGHITVVLPQLSCSVSKSYGLTFADGVAEPVSGLAVGP